MIPMNTISKTTNKTTTTNKEEILEILEILEIENAKLKSTVNILETKIAVMQSELEKTKDYLYTGFKTTS